MWYEVWGREPGKPAVELLFKFPAQVISRADVEALVKDCRNRGCTEMSIREVAPRRPNMAKRTFALTAAQKQQCEALGIDWQKLLSDLAANAPKIIAFLLSLFQSNPPPKMAKAGCCDHHACCHAVLCAALETAAKAADHCCQCEQEEPT